MKYFIRSLLLICLICACSQKPSTKKYPQWPVTGVAEADSIFPKLHDAFDNGKPDETIIPLIERVRFLSAKNGKNDILYGAQKYWEARFLIRSGHFDDAQKEIMEGLSRIDSTSQTYYFFKLRSLLERTRPTVYERYRTGMENLMYFRSIGDSLSVAHSLVTIGNLLRVVGEKEKALSAFQQAEKIWKDAGIDRNYYGNQINIALCLDKAREDSLSRKLLQNPVIQADTSAYTLLIRNIASSAVERGDTSEAYRLSMMGLDIIGESEHYEGNAAVLHSIAALGKLREGDRVGALESSREALKLSDRPTEKYAEFDVLYSAANVYRDNNIIDSAFYWLNRAMEIRMDNDFELNNITLGVEEARQSMMQLQFSNELNRVRTQLWIAISMGLFIIAIVVSILLYRKIQARKLKEKQALEQLEESRSNLARETLMFEQSENLIDRLKSQIELERDNGGITTASASNLLSELRNQIADRGERQAFLDVHNHLLPRFSARLKGEFPDLTEHQIKLAAYIASGMSNAIIAKLLNITPSSVRTLRYRMRSKFGLKRSESLEEYLRRFTE